MQVSSHVMVGTPALKEWAVICHALLAGEQVIDLRKGGLRESGSPEGGRHFDVGTTRAWLYPTAEHQRAELLKPPYQHWIDLAPSAPVGHDITLHGWVEVFESHTITDGAILERLTPKVIWSDEYAASRLKWKQRDPLWVLILRAQRLVEPIVVPWSEEYGGCTSWVEFMGLPDSPTTLASEPALSDESFAARVKGVHEGLGVTR